MKNIVLSSLILLVLIFCGASVSTRAFEIQNPSVSPVSRPLERRESETRVREISAYTVGRTQETDDTPCIGASGDDLCKLVKAGVVVYASNEFPLRTRITVDGVEGIVLDRMNRRYPTQVDVAMLNYQEAKEFGRQKLSVQIIK